MASLTLLVLTRNEAPRLGRCLESFREVVDQILVVDSESDDGTADLAREFGARVVSRPWPGRSAQSMYARELIDTDWFFHADADEVATPELRRDLRAAVEEDLPGVDGYGVDRHEWFLGRPVRCGLNRQLLRLCRTEPAVMEMRRAHAGWTVPGEVLQLRGALWHRVDQPLPELIDKWTRRGLLSARDYYDRGVRPSYARLLWHPGWTFTKHWLLKGGCFDGMPGLILAGLRAMYCFCRLAHLHELWTERPSES